MLSVRKFALELSRMTPTEQPVAFVLRQAELDDLASDLRKKARTAWKKPASFALTLIGAAASVMTSPVAAAISIGARLVGYESASKVDTGAYSYLFNAQSRFGGY